MVPSFSRIEISGCNNSCHNFNLDKLFQVTPVSRNFEGIQVDTSGTVGNLFNSTPETNECPLKRDSFSRENVFQPLIFRGHLRIKQAPRLKIWTIPPSSFIPTRGSVGPQVPHISPSTRRVRTTKAPTKLCLPHCHQCVLSVSLCGIFVCCSCGKTSTDRQPAGMQLHAGLAEINGKGHRFRRCRRPEWLKSGGMTKGSRDLHVIVVASCENTNNHASKELQPRTKKSVS